MLDAIRDTIGRFDWFLIALFALPITGVLVSFRRFLLRHALSIADAIQYQLGKRIDFTLSASASMRTYCRKSLERPDRQSLRVPGDDRELKIDQVFVNLSLDTADERSFTNADVLQAGRRQRIVGDPGSGKSSLTKRLFRDACRSGIDMPKSSPLPILIELKTLKPPRNVVTDDDLSEWIWETCRTQVNAIQGYDMASLFERFAQSQNAGVLVLLDGLDEVAAADYPAIRKCLNLLSHRLASASTANSIIITMRVQFHHESREDFAESYPTVLTVQRFTPGDVYDFLVRWFAASSSAVGTASTIHAELAERPSLRDLCRNPLILAMYVSNYLRVQSQDLPDTRTEFYSIVGQELLVRRRREQLKTRSPRVVALRQRKEIFGLLALDNMLDPDQSTNSLSWARAIAVIKDVTGVSDDDHASEIFKRLATETGLITQEREEESFRFLHRSLCEYFAALEAAEEAATTSWRRLLDKHAEFVSDGRQRTRSRLDDCIPFMVALIPGRDQQREALKRIGELNDLPLIGRCLLETQAYDQPLWTKYAEGEMHYLLQIDYDNWDAAWLERLHLFQSVADDAANTFRTIAQAPDTFTVDLSTMFSELVGESRIRLHALFASYAREGALAAFNLASGLGVDLVTETPELLVDANINEPPFLAFAMERAGEEDQSKIAHWASVLTEAALRSRLVARRLHEARCPQRWLAAYHSVPKKYRWDEVLGSIEKSIPSYYAAALSIALPNLDLQVSADRFPMLTMLRRIPHPGYRKVLNLFIGGSFLIVGLLSFGFVAYLIFSGLTDEPRLDYMGMVIGTYVSFFFPLLTLTYFFMFRSFYRGLVLVGAWDIGTRPRGRYALGEAFGMAPFRTLNRRSLAEAQPLVDEHRVSGYVVPGTRSIAFASLARKQEVEEGS